MCIQNRNCKSALRRIASVAATACLALAPLVAQRPINTTLTLPIELPSGNYTLELFDTFQSVLAIAAPQGEPNQLYFVERAGRIIIYSDLENQIRQQTPFLDISGPVTDNFENGLLGLAFHPQYLINGYFYLFYTTNESGSATNRISRFSRSAGNPLLADPDSEIILIDQVDQAANHNGGDLHFGPDGYLYASLGDEGDANDSRNNSQIVDKDFFAGIIRIDVDKLPENIEPTEHPDIPRDNQGNAHYSVPADNPLVAQWQSDGSDPESDLRLEFYAIGLRNPWRMSFDPATGELWTGDVGQGAREEIDIIEKGDNYGWAFREGTIAGPKSQTPPQGFETIVDPIHEYGRSLGVSITGGIVYRGTRLPELESTYLFADYGSGRVWTLFRDPDGGAPTVEEIASVSSPVAFGRDPSNGDVLISSLSGNVFRLIRGQGQESAFPQTLTDTGAFTSLETLEPETGILPYTPNLSFWSDYAIKQRWVSVPDETVAYSEDDPWTFPAGSVWIKHFDLELDRGDPESKTRVETRFIVKTPNGVYGLSYQWNEAQTEATLVGEDGVEIDYSITDNGSSSTQTWRIPSRQECLQCHTGVAGYALSFNTRQLNRIQTVGEEERNFLSYLSEIGILDTDITEPQSIPIFHEPSDETATLEARVRSYLAVNCISCHQPGASAPTNWDARAHLTTEQTGLINGLIGNDGGNSNRRLVVRGSPDLSVLLSRVQGAHGFERMPPLASNEIDQSAIELLTAWINLTPPSNASFTEWQTSFFGDPTAPEAAFDADPDHDDNSNFLEFLNRTHPLDNRERWQPNFGHTGSAACIEFSMAPSRNYEVQISDDLQSWQPWDIPGNPPESDELEETQAKLTGPLPAEDGSSFLRVRVSE